MISLDIPGAGRLCLLHLVCDYNGTLASDGELLPGVAGALRELAADLRIHVVTADTFGQAGEQLRGLPIELVVIANESQAEVKLEYVTRLGVEGVVAVGNGRNDRLMLQAAALGVAVVQQEGAAAAALAAADVVVTSVIDAFGLLRSPRRLLATLRA